MFVLYDEENNISIDLEFICDPLTEALGNVEFCLNPRGTIGQSLEGEKRERLIRAEVQLELVVHYLKGILEEVCASQGTGETGASTSKRITNPNGH